MKKIILIIGPNGVGKSTTSQVLLHKLSHSAYIDSDYCRMINPFVLTEYTREAVTNNLYCMMKNYLVCTDIETVIFPYAFHGDRKERFEKVLQKLEEDNIGYTLCPVILKCSKEENISRSIKDGRDSVRIERGMKDTFSFYDKYTYPVIDSTKLSPDEVAEKVIDFVFGNELED